MSEKFDTVWEDDQIVVKGRTDGYVVVEQKKEEGKKYDGGKSPVWQGVLQYFPKAISAVGSISQYGAEKYNLDYSDINWSRVEGGYERYSDAAMRHVLGEFIDGAYDTESKRLHAAMLAWNALARLELLLSSGVPLVQPVQE